MAMRVLAVCGSPRKGNTEAMLREVLRGAECAGADTELVLLRELDVKHCGGCMVCEDSHVCHVKDDMQGLYGKVLGSDVLVLGSPNYFNNVSGIMKDFIDRFCPHWEGGMRGKPVVLVSVGGEEARSASDAMKEFCKICSMKVVASLEGKAYDSDGVGSNPAKMKECFDAGRKVAISQHNNAKTRK